MRNAAKVAWQVEDGRLKLSLANQREAFEPARRAVIDFLAAHAPGETLRYQVELILEETLMNMIWHAFDDHEAHRIALDVEVGPDQVVLRFDDDGIAFDPLQAAPPVLPTSIDEARPGGLGLMLVRRLARSVAYARDDGRNRLTIALARA
jgi:serine/threonine-protein kinase RsbW